MSCQCKIGGVCLRKGIPASPVRFVMRWLDFRYAGAVVRHTFRLASRKLKWLTIFLWRSARSMNRRESNDPFGRSGLGRCHTLYINLESRADRQASMELLFAENNIRSTRIEAVSAVPGILGCGQSHVKALSSPAPIDTPIVVCEDDLIFKVSRAELDEIVDEFLSNSALDVLCLAYNLRAKPVPISRALQITDNTQTTACYVVKPHAVPYVRQSFAESVENLMGGADTKKAALDIAWKKLQGGKLIFAAPRKRVAVQRPGFSDIAEAFVDYGV